MIRLDWKLTLIKQINQSLDSEPSEFNGTKLTNFRSIKFVGKIDYNNQIYLYSLNEKGAPGFDLINPIIINNKLFLVNRGWIPRNQKGKKFQLNNKNFTAILKEKSKFNYFKPENDLENNYWFTLNDEDLNKFKSLTICGMTPEGICLDEVRKNLPSPSYYQEVFLLNI